MIYYLTHVIYANGKKALACWYNDEKLTVTNHIYLKHQLFDVYLHLYTPVDRAISAFLRTIFSSTSSGIYMTFLCSPS